MLKDKMNVRLGGRVVIFSCSSGQFILIPPWVAGQHVVPMLKDENYLLEGPFG